MIKKSFLSLLFIIIFFIPLKAERIKLAVLDFKAVKGTPESIAERTSEWLRSEMITNNFSVVEKSSMEKILYNQSFLSSGCIKSSCAVKAGRLLSAKKVLIGTVSMIRKKIIITAQMIDVDKEKKDFQHKDTIGTIRNLDKGVKQFAQDIDIKAQKFFTIIPDKKESVQPEISHTETRSGQPSGPHESFVGTWNTTYGQLKITRSGGNFIGSYYNGLASLNGIMTGNKLDFTWHESTGTGRGSFTLSDDGNSFSGYWVAGSSTEIKWNGTRIK